ncbi:methyl-accepting chemotaxis protein [Marinobacter sp. LV10R510-11A]|uniref:methyl-accepting chemotaxis protein n=1 Tax=Marinobacter sp. LV10R510-11A TaxID=1415568 RepID=UPI000BB97B30|nr:methyl-accepting chemotaxis protein [Marinobacter sp. LV10R510-11A]SOB75914.1 methyl-accepting chemotaxis protein [Marinobacter sp. LV10R510-11A]
MKQLINPAVALMNRLPMLYKFSLISILFLLPIGGLSWLVMTELNRSVETMTRGVEGLEQLRQIDRLVDASFDYRDYRAPAVAKNEDAIMARSDEAAKKISAILDGLTAEARSFDVSGAWADQVEALKSDWQSVRADDNYQTNFDPQFKYFQGFVQKVLALLPGTIESSGLGQGTSRENLLVLGLIRETLPEARSVIGKARSYGMYALVDGQIGYALSDNFNEIYDGLTNRGSLVSPALTLAADTSPALASKAGDALRSVDESLLNVRELVDLNIITPMRLELSWQEYDSRIATELTGYGELKAAAFDVIEANLNASLDQEVSQRRLIVVALIVVLLIVVYLYIGFFMSVRTAINRFSEAARKVAAGDMTTRISLDNRDELGELTGEFNSMTDRIAELIRSVSRTTSDVDQQAARVKVTATANSEAVANQMAESGQINEAMSQMVEAVSEVTESAHRVADSATAAEQDTETGRGVVSDTVETINRLATEISGAVDVINRVSEDSDNISQVLVEIKAIAGQTNLLALNAAIEAARAGEQGRGFAVVADEVRSLSQRTHKSTEEIEGMISRLQSGVKDAVAAMTNSRDVTQATVQKSGEVTEALSRIAKGISVIVDMSHQIAQAAEEQSAVSKDVNASVAHIGELGTSTAANAKETLASSSEMSELTASLQRLVEAFKV